MELITEIPPTAKKGKFKRVIAQLRGKAPGPTVIAIGGMHGNEPSGVFALERVGRKLRETEASLRGEFIALAGNLKALQLGERYLDKDLNRIWFPAEGSTELRTPEGLAETSEFLEILQVIREAIQRRRGEVIFVDLHTTSAQSPPFCLIGDTLRNREFVREFPVPIILGLEEQLEGPLLSYLNERGFISFGFEAGQHNDPVSPVLHESMMWCVLQRAGLLTETEDMPWLHAARESLSAHTRKLQKVFEIRYRHGIVPENRFKMNPGYINFQPIRKGEVLAGAAEGPVTAKENGRIFMPLYQSQGDDGFFIIRKVAGFWLGFSRILRKTGAWKILPILPGVRKHKRIPHTLVLNTRIARFFGREIFHLMGYRKRRRHGDKVLFTRREFDLNSPPLN